MSRLIRKYVPGDFEACLGIHRANFEAGLIPDHYEEDFLANLDFPEILTLVIVIDGKLLGCGSVACFWEGTGFFANLSFGFIHPDHHRKKLGSYLLVSRLSLLDDNDGQCAVYLSAIEGSVGFYADVVGFSEYHQALDERGNRFHELRLDVGPRRLQDARDYTAASGFEMEPDLQVPVSRDGVIREVSRD